MSLKTSLAVAATAISLTAFTSPAQAALFNFSYTLIGGDVLSGMLDGDVQGDGDTVSVNSISMPLFNGVAGPDLPFVVSNSAGPSLPATVSFSGSVMDIIACTNSDCGDGFLFDGSMYISGVSYGDAFEPYNPNNWSLTAKATEAVPEPGSVVALLGLGLGALALNGKKQA
ncbi:PEP-CTERM sorting domain-containing protein [Crocosphaera sp. UHCC 0190]|uniref:PEP-CTERM sorting domain-containing protein n=1 Tax=Crocosphaera sp. UHCC 0190 TaxID=3110246 RepID=UPI002B212C01|nr:PEP-CTERM sorting domain-containing protein [Crocosphaera sp. UHCC 0190]MEA5509728.1 PEP-CTERM sorting domain-containing protein [Crocosphaera sp. UHCC 0190]